MSPFQDCLASCFSHVAPTFPQITGCPIYPPQPTSLSYGPQKPKTPKTELSVFNRSNNSSPLSSSPFNAMMRSPTAIRDELPLRSSSLFHRSTRPLATTLLMRTPPNLSKFAQLISEEFELDEKIGPITNKSSINNKMVIIPKLHVLLIRFLQPPLFFAQYNFNCFPLKNWWGEIQLWRSSYDFHKFLDLIRSQPSACWQHSMLYISSLL